MGEGVKKIREFLCGRPVLYAAVTGLDKKPDVHPVELCFGSEDALYFAAAKCEAFYGELSQYPYVKLCAFDADEGVILKLSGKAVFTEDEAIVTKCISECRSIREAWGHDPKMVIAWFLKDAVGEFISVRDGSKQAVELGTPENALIGIRIKKDKQLRDRLSSIMEERENTVVAAQSESDLFVQKLYDGAVLYFAQTAKRLWPRMDIGPIERSAAFETYDELERFTGLAKKLAGNAEIVSPEDLTYWLNKQTLESRAREQQAAPGVENGKN